MDDIKSTSPNVPMEKHAYRIIYLDYLRIAATFAVVIIHLAAQFWYITDVNGYEWNVFNFYDSIVRWAVPVFVMISGALFLKRNLSMKEIYSKYVLRLVCSFFFWSFIYALYSEGGGAAPEQLIKATLRGSIYMWFIPMIIGMYICIPLIQAIIQKQQNMKYFICLSFVFAFVFPQILQMTYDFLPEVIQQYVSLFNIHVRDMNLELVLGYTIYFILGYYLDSADLTKKQRGIIYLLGVIGFASTIMLSAIISIKQQSASEYYYGEFTVNVFLESIAVYVWFKYNAKKIRLLEKVIIVISKYSFGVYLIHVLVLNELEKAGVNTLSFNPIYSVPIIGAIIFVIAFGCSAIINNLPILKKYII